MASKWCSCECWAVFGWFFSLDRVFSIYQTPIIIIIKRVETVNYIYLHMCLYIVSTRPPRLRSIEAYVTMAILFLIASIVCPSPIPPSSIVKLFSSRWLIRNAKNILVSKLKFIVYSRRRVFIKITNLKQLP